MDAGNTGEQTQPCIGESEYLELALAAYADGDLTESEKAQLSADAVRLGLAREDKIRILNAARIASDVHARGKTALAWQPDVERVSAKGMLSVMPPMSHNQASAQQNWEQICSLWLSAEDLASDPALVLRRECDGEGLDAESMLQLSDWTPKELLEGLQLFRAFRFILNVDLDVLLPSIPDQHYHQLAAVFPYILRSRDSAQVFHATRMFISIDDKYRGIFLDGVLECLPELTGESYGDKPGWWIRDLLYSHLKFVAINNPAMIALSQSFIYSDEHYRTRGTAISHMLEVETHRLDELIDILEDWLYSDVEEQRELACLLIGDAIVDAASAGLDWSRMILLLGPVAAGDPSFNVRRTAAEQLEKFD